MMVNGGFEARTDVAHPSVASTAASTTSYRSARRARNMAVIEGVTMTGMQRRSRAPDQDRVGHHGLQPRRRLHHPPQRRTQLNHAAYHN